MRDELSNPSRTIDIIKKHEFTFKKSLGQNFLIDRNILQKIISEAKLEPGDGVLEIGPGIGSLTEILSHHVKKVVAIEIDQRLIPILEENFAANSSIEIIHGDVLGQDLPALLTDKFEEGQRVHVVANLPYYVTTPILMKLLEERLPLTSIVIMIQKEVAERIAATPGTKAYGSLSVASQYYAEPHYCMTVPKTVFIPQPNVDSAVIRLEIRKKPDVQLLNEIHFFRVVRTAFAQRRKTLYNNLRSEFKGEIDWNDILLSLNISPQRRGETLSIGEFAALSNELFRRGIE